MNQPIQQTTAYKEIKIGHTIYRVTSVFTGEKNLKDSLEQLAIRRVMDEAFTPPGTMQ